MTQMLLEVCHTHSAGSAVWYVGTVVLGYHPPLRSGAVAPSQPCETSGMQLVPSDVDAHGSIGAANAPRDDGTVHADIAIRHDILK